MLAELAFVIVVLIAVGVALVLVVRAQKGRQRRRELSSRFGPEYERAIAEYGSETRAEYELAKRAQRMAKLEIRELAPLDRVQYSESWQKVQSQFVDAPVSSVLEANELIKRVMRARGYPVEDFDQRVKDLSVDHPHVVQHYRAARTLASATKAGRASTEDLRQAFIHFRALFADLLGEHDAPPLVGGRAAHA
jgi:hypothetical protein